MTYFVVSKIIHYFHLELTYFDKDYLYPFLKKVFIALLLLHVASFVSDIVSTIKHLNSFGSILSSIVFISLLLTFFAMNSHKEQMEKEIALKQKKFEQKHLQNYTDEIVGLYNEIRGFDMIMLGCLSACRWQLTVVIYRKLTEFTMKFGQSQSQTAFR